MGNLHLVTGYSGTAHVTAADAGSFNAAIIGEDQYVLNRGNKFAASVITNNKIRISDGDILMQGRHIRLNEGETVDLTIENGASGYYRNDLIVARYTKTGDSGIEECNLVVIKGTAVTSNPSDPEYTSGDIINDHVLVADMPLYRVPLNGLNVQELEPLFTLVSVNLLNAGSDKQLATDRLTKGSDIVDGDYFPFYDVSANSNKKVLWSVIKSALAKVFASLSHAHAAGDITSGTMPIVRGGTEATTAAEARANLGAAAKKTLLWTNASPASSFVAQTLTLSSLNSYDTFIMVCNTWNGYQSIGMAFPTGENSIYGMAVFPYSYSGSNYIESRSFGVNPSANSIWIGDCVYAYEGSTDSNNSYSIPLRIYGIKTT